MAWYQNFVQSKLNTFRLKTHQKTSVLDEESIKALIDELDKFIMKNFVARQELFTLIRREVTVESLLSMNLDKQLIGHVMLAKDDLFKKLQRSKALESCMDYENELNRTLRCIVTEYKAILEAIRLKLEFWEAQPIISKSEDFLIELINNEFDYFSSVSNKTDRVKNRITFLHRIGAKIDEKWPKFEERSLIANYIEFLKIQIQDLQFELREKERENKKCEKKVRKLNKRCIKLQRRDMFSKKHNLSLTKPNLDHWAYLKRDLNYCNMCECTNIIKLQDKIEILKRHQIDLSNHVDELKRYEQEVANVKENNKMLQAELTHKNKLFTQVAIENIKLRKLNLNVDFPEFPESENATIQQLVQNEIELTLKIGELEDKIEKSGKQAELHKQHSRHVANNLRELISYLEQVTEEFLLEEEVEGKNVDELRQLLEDEQWQSFVLSLNPGDYEDLQKALERGDVEQVLRRLNENSARHRSDLYELTHELSGDELARLIASLEGHELSGLVEALAQRRIDNIVRVVREAKQKIRQSERETSIDVEQVRDVVSQLQQLCCVPHSDAANQN